MNNLSIFENSQFGKIRVINEMFVATDVCRALELVNASQSVSRLDEDEKGIISNDTGELIVITESGLYSLVLSSRKPEAKDFKRWITHDVIPSIRKHGAYMTPDALEAAIANPDMMIGLLQNLKAHQAEIAAQQNYIAVLEPKAEFYDAVAGSKTAIDIGNASKVLGISGIGRNKLFDILREQRILDGSNIPYQLYIDRGYFRVIEQKYNMPNGEVRINFKTLVYQRGLDFIRKVVAKAA